MEQAAKEQEQAAEHATKKQAEAAITTAITISPTSSTAPGPPVLSAGSAVSAVSPPPPLPVPVPVPMPVPGYGRRYLVNAATLTDVDAELCVIVKAYTPGVCVCVCVCVTEVDNELCMIVKAYHLPRVGIVINPLARSFSPTTLKKYAYMRRFMTERRH